MPRFQYNCNKRERKKRLAILRKSHMKNHPRQAVSSTLVDLMHLYFEGELKVDYFIDWCSRVYRGVSVDRAIVINDCSFSRVFTRELMDIISIMIPSCDIVYLIRTDEPLDESKHALSFEILSMLLHEDRSVLGYKTDIKNANCIIVIPHSSYLRRELSPDGVTIVLNVRSCFSNVLDEERLMERYYIAVRTERLLEEFEERLMQNENN